MGAAEFSAGHGGGIGREEAARLLGAAEGTPSLASRRDLRLWALTATVIGVLMGLCVALSPVSSWFTIAYIVVLLAFILVQRRYATVAPRGVTPLYNIAVGVATVLVVASIFGLGVLFDGYDNAPFWASVIAGVLVASPMVTAAGIISRTAV